MNARRQPHFQCFTLVLIICAIALTVDRALEAAQSETKSAPVETIAPETADQQQHEWRPLFNGKDLTGWTPKIRFSPLGENFKNTFRVEDGVLKVSYDEYEKFEARFGHLFYETPFSNYDLRVEYRIVGKQTLGGAGWAHKNSGIMIHGQDPKTMALDQTFPAAIEVQLKGGDGTKEQPNLRLCTPGTHVTMDGELVTQHCNDSTARTVHDDEWILVELEVRGNKVIRHKMDGEVVLEYQQPQLDPTDPLAKPIVERDQLDTPEKLQLSGGTISLQSESHPIEFRKVEIREIP